MRRIALNKSKGFTLIELLVVIVVSGILITILWKLWFVAYVQVLNVRHKNATEQDLEISLVKVNKKLQGFENWGSLEEGLLVWWSRKEGVLSLDSLDYRYLEEDSLVVLSGDTLWQGVHNFQVDFWVISNEGESQEEDNEYFLEKVSLRDFNGNKELIVGLDYHFKYGKFERQYRESINLRK
jgi:prepilin-type N-terminal cleavage/methylation domain-containing protein